MPRLDDIRVAIIATDGFEEPELIEPRKALEEAGASVDVLSDHSGEIQALRHMEKGGKVPVDRTLDQAMIEDYDAVMLPGGAMNADKARMDPNVREFLRSFMRAGKPIAAICHAPWELASAGVAHGRRLTSYYTIQDDMRNAGADWVDQEVVVNDNLVTSRQPSDIPAFNREMIALFARVPAGARR